jgi:hypothetical protein
MTPTWHVLEKLSIYQNRRRFHPIKLAFGAVGHNVAGPLILHFISNNGWLKAPKLTLAELDCLIFSSVANSNKIA